MNFNSIVNHFFIFLKDKHRTVHMYQMMYILSAYLIIYVIGYLSTMVILNKLFFSYLNT